MLGSCAAAAVAPARTRASAAAQSLPSIVPENADFGMAPANAASPMTWMFLCCSNSKVTGSTGRPAGAVGNAGQRRDLAGLLRRDDIGDGVLVGVEIGLDGFLLDVDRRDIAAGRQRLPFDHAGIKLLPGIEEQRLHGEGVLGIEDDHLRARLVGFQGARERQVLTGAHRQQITPSYAAHLFEQRHIESGRPGKRRVSAKQEIACFSRLFKSREFMTGHSF